MNYNILYYFCVSMQCLRGSRLVNELEIKNAQPTRVYTTIKYYYNNRTLTTTRRVSLLGIYYVLGEGNAEKENKRVTYSPYYTRL